jgi:hypothetical protein
MRHVQADDRRFYSTVLLATVPLQVTFGWLFLMAGTGQWLLLSGLITAVAGVVLAPSILRLLAGLIGLMLGCAAPFALLFFWFAAP